MALVTFTNTTCVNLTECSIAVDPPTVGDVLEPNEVTTYDGVSDDVITNMGVFVWVETAVVPPNYACMWTVCTPEGATMLCQSVADDDSARVAVKAAASGEKREMPPKRQSGA